MIKKVHISALVMAMLFGLLLTAAAPDTMAQGRSRRQAQSQVYYDQDSDYRNDYWGRNREDTTGKAVGRTAIGAGIGAAGGALIGGKKGALIGAGVGAVGGYMYHRNKVGRERDRRWLPW
jgi:hypothetical protein